MGLDFRELFDSSSRFQELHSTRSWKAWRNLKWYFLVISCISEMLGLSFICNKPPRHTHIMSLNTAELCFFNFSI